MDWREYMVAKSYIRGYEVSWNERLMRWDIRDSDTYKTIPFDDGLDRYSGEDGSVNTFDLVEKGDLVCGVDEHSADIRVVEGIIKNEGENNNILLVNSRKDLFYEGSQEIELFNKEWKLLCKREFLVK